MVWNVNIILVLAIVRYTTDKIISCSFFMLYGLKISGLHKSTTNEKRNNKIFYNNLSAKMNTIDMKSKLISCLAF